MSRIILGGHLRVFDIASCIWLGEGVSAYKHLVPGPNLQRYSITLSASENATAPGPLFATVLDVLHKNETTLKRLDLAYDCELEADILARWTAASGAMRLPSRLRNVNIDGPQSLSLIKALLAHVNLSSVTVLKLFLQSSAEEYDALVRLLPSDFPNLRLLHVIEAAGGKVPAGDFKDISASQALQSVCLRHGITLTTHTRNVTDVSVDGNSYPWSLVRRTVGSSNLGMLGLLGLGILLDMSGVDLSYTWCML